MDTSYYWHPITDLFLINQPIFLFNKSKNTYNMGVKISRTMFVFENDGHLEWEINNKLSSNGYDNWAYCDQKILKNKLKL